VARAWHLWLARRRRARLKVAFVVQRYGTEVCGGSELLCRQIAELMAKFWDVEVLTSCAVDYLTWENHYPEGLTHVNSISVRRFAVDFPRDLQRFGEASRKVLTEPHGRQDEVEWMRAQGPYSTRFNEYVESQGAQYDFLIFFTYLYCYTFFGLPAVADKAGLVPTAHDEPPIYLEIFRPIFRMPRVLFFSTPEEQDFVNGLFGTHRIPQDVVGAGVEQPHDVLPQRFLHRHGPTLEGRDVVLYAGRLDVNKGVAELFGHFARFRQDRPERAAKLVLIGSRGTLEIPAHPDIIYLGFVSDQEKFDAMAAAKVVVLSSPFESLSLTVLEAWRVGTPVLVNGACKVLRQQCTRSNGGLWYESYAEFREALDLLLREPRLQEGLGASGRAFVEREYDWDVIAAQYRRLVDSALASPERRRRVRI